MSGKMTRPGGETSENPRRSWGGAANSNTSRQADAQPIGRSVKPVTPSTSGTSSAKPATDGQPKLPINRDFGGDGVPLGGTYSNPMSSPNLGKK